MNESKAIYRRLCEITPDIPLFLRYEWVNALYSEWDIALAYKSDDCFAFMILPLSQKKGFRLIHIPPLSPFQGFYIKYPEGQKQTSRLSFQKTMLNDLIAQIPKNDWYLQKLPYGFTNFLPFYWQGFNIIPKITYRLDLSLSENNLWLNLKENIRRAIKKSEKQIQITIGQSANQLYHIKQTNAAANNEPITYSKSYLQKIATLATTNNCGTIYEASINNQIIASVFVVYDNQSAYYLIGGVLPSFKNSGVMSHLLWHAILHAKAQGVPYFNFEGSMIEPIERFFRSFGAEQQLYFEVEKISNPVLKLKNKLF